MRKTNMLLSELGIIPQKIKQFEKKGISTVEDLLRFYPTKYMDYRNPIRIADGQKYDGVRVAVRGRILSVKVIKGLHTMARITDGTGTCSVMWFNRPYLTKQLVVGESIGVGGPATWNSDYNSLSIAPPDFMTRDVRNGFGIVPVYRKIPGMSDQYLHDAIDMALGHIQDCIDETLTQEQRDALQIPDAYTAIRMAHRPQEEGELVLSERRRNVDVLFPFCMGLEQKRQEASATSPYRVIDADDLLQKACRKLPFALTTDQAGALSSILSKMEMGKRVDALVQGDVGCGKTVVAEIAAMAMAESGFQCAVMCPTVVLASQHYDGFRGLLDQFGIQTVFLHGGMKAKEEREALAKIASGEAQVIVGTHSVISDKVMYRNLGLTIVDEEHRFGVEQREALRKKATQGVHNIGMSATPIPRTLATTLYGEGTEILNIHTMPAGRKPVKTIVWSNENTCFQSVYKQIQQGHQCYVICPLIEDSEAETLAGVDSVESTEQSLREWFKKYPEVAIEAISGDMKSSEVQERIDRFAVGQAQVLISTTIVEVGVNVPNATVIVIKNAERFGLAQLHQLRGRVGRGNAQSYCVLLSKDKTAERLQIMASTTDGFKIAEEDMRLRGTGQILGVKQSGKDPYLEAMLAHPALYKAVRKQVQLALRKTTQKSRAKQNVG